MKWKIPGRLAGACSLGLVLVVGCQHDRDFAGSYAGGPACPCSQLAPLGQPVVAPQAPPRAGYLPPYVRHSPPTSTPYMSAYRAPIPQQIPPAACDGLGVRMLAGPQAAWPAPQAAAPVFPGEARSGLPVGEPRVVEVPARPAPAPEMPPAPALPLPRPMPTAPPLPVSEATPPPAPVPPPAIEPATEMVSTGPGEEPVEVASAPPQPALPAAVTPAPEPLAPEPPAPEPSVSVKTTVSEQPAVRPGYGHAADYTWLCGEVQQTRKGVRLRYAPLDEVDPYGGSVTLMADAGVAGLRDGDFVRVIGRLVSPDRAAVAPAYKVLSVEPANR